MILRDDRRRIAELCQNREASAGNLQLPLDRLEGIGHAADGDDVRLPLRRQKLLAKQLGGILLDDDLRLEVEASGEAEVFVGRPSEAVDAAVLTSAIRIDAVSEADVGAVVVGDDGSNRIAQIDRTRRLLVRRRVFVADVRQLLKPILRVPRSPSTLYKLSIR